MSFKETILYTTYDGRRIQSEMYVAINDDSEDNQVNFISVSVR